MPIWTYASVNGQANGRKIVLRRRKGEGGFRSGGLCPTPAEMWFKQNVLDKSVRQAYETKTTNYRQVKAATTLLLCHEKRGNERAIIGKIGGKGTEEDITVCAVAQHCYNGDVSFLWEKWKL